jgi:cobalt-zinc-cadmium efflux system membrane fusion protein
VQTGAPVNGIVLPEAAVVRGANGLEQIWVKVGAEQFQSKAVKTEPLGGTEVLVTAGLETGNRVVVSGSEFVNQVR